VIIRWLADNGIEYFTASAAKSPETYRRLSEIKQVLGMVKPAHYRQGQSHDLLQLAAERDAMRDRLGSPQRRPRWWISQGGGLAGAAGLR
jgi:hypothetical protein